MSHMPYQQETFSACDHRNVVKFTLVITYQYIKFKLLPVTVTGHNIISHFH